MTEPRADLTGLHADLKACALSAIPVDPDDGTTFIKTEGDSRVWGSPQVVAAAVASATYTVMGIRLDDAYAAGHAALAADLRDLAERMHRRADDGDNPSDCGAMADFADELLRIVLVAEGIKTDG